MHRSDTAMPPDEAVPEATTPETTDRGTTEQLSLARRLVFPMAVVAGMIVVLLIRGDHGLAGFLAVFGAVLLLGIAVFGRAVERRWPNAHEALGPLAVGGSCGPLGSELGIVPALVVIVLGGVFGGVFGGVVDTVVARFWRARPTADTTP